ncbi:hypothetical protein QLQ85_09805 [Halomonas sp. M4R5S39]|uniref:hypothetical protein n=1 Tax=Halomonas kalidii TaxID=3043293 RepID=UPI0024A9B815|nr:hypothetical protein [Halomonas kalidii]MDI5985088.1 hypothetical protein [Halomonas kalidii]
MKTITVICAMVIALLLAFGVAAEQILKPIHAYRLGGDDQRAVMYYAERGAGYEVVTTWVGEEEVLMRHIAYLEPGQRYTLSLIERGLPVQFTVHSDAGQVVMVGESEAPAYARQCHGHEDGYPTPLQRLVLCPRGQRIDSADPAPQLTASGPGSVVIGE